MLFTSRKGRTTIDGSREGVWVGGGGTKVVDGSWYGGKSERGL